MNFLKENKNGAESKTERIATKMFDCTLENYRSLKGRIQKCDGKIVILVHPFFEHEHKEPTPKNKVKAEKLKEVTEKLENLFSDIRNSEIPVIVMQETAHMPRRDVYLTGDPRQNVFFIPTKSADPMPEFEYPGAFGLRAVKGGWAEAVRTLHDLKVREITLGGMYLWSGTDWLGKEHNSGCAGLAYERLKKEFSVKLSDMTFPN